MFLKLPPSVIWILLFGLIFRSIIAFWLLPGYDEGYYYLYTQHLDWSYFDHPVFVALTTGFGIWLTGITSPFTLRIGTVFLYTGSLLLLYFTSARLFNVKAAKITLIIASIIPIFQIGFGIVTLPDSPLIFFWSAALYCAVYEFFPVDNQIYRPSYRLSILGILIGLACLSKYHGFVLGFSLVAFCLSSYSHRRALFSRWTGLGLILFIVTLFPLLFWNFNHDWISFKFQFFNRFLPVPNVPKSPYNILNSLVVFGVGIGLLFPTIGFPLWWVLFRTLLLQLFVPLRKYGQVDLDGANKPYFWEKQLFILWLSLPLTLGLIILGGKQQILVTWPIPGYWGATLLLGLYAVKWEKYSKFWVEWWLKGSTIIITTILLLFLIHLNTGTLLKSSQNVLLGGVFTSDNDPSNELIDVKQLREGIANSPILYNALKEADFLFTNAYYLGGLIDLALKPLNPIPVTCFSYDRRGFPFWPDTDQWVGKNALYITLKRFAEMPELTAEFSAFFESIEEIGTVEIKRGGVIVNVFYVYQAHNLLKPYFSTENSVR
ncbi:ArnT family glycosyltransferase [Crocosphaera sp. XPORK-15E]|uniref:ArnT family glycosyltransferase n=1 Tax=Crocosphaera sp. XPORK-15E TaxID=3110247 RepID=UPI002B204115|nr:glycosyltransferase family 39 protein [Crocosphaera sp. XPORK-15E]MEA5536987.1 glycosyltransferase family 39 protein [Crocosphaera sp. XPORK-15E]